MRVLLASDLHVHAWTEFATTTAEGLNSRMMDCLRVLDDMIAYTQTHSVGAIVLGGDIFHRRGVIYTSAYNEVLKRLRGFAGHTVFIVDGNHDHATKIGSIHAVESLALSGSCVGIDPALGWRNLAVNGLVLTGFSYCDSREVLARRVDAAQKEYDEHFSGDPRIGIFHHGFKGAAVGASLEYVVREDIDVEPLVERFDMLFSGHYHRRQFINNNERAVYIGSPLEHVRGDGHVDHKKGFLVYSSTKMNFKIKSVEAPRFVKLNQWLIETTDEQSMIELVHGNFVDVSYTDLGTDWLTFATQLQDYGARGIKQLPTPVVKAATAGPRLDVDLAMTPTEIMKRYIKHTQTEGDAKDLLRKGLAYYNQAGELA